MQGYRVCSGWHSNVINQWLSIIGVISLSLIKLLSLRSGAIYSPTDSICFSRVEVSIGLPDSSSRAVGEAATTRVDENVDGSRCSRLDDQKQPTERDEERTKWTPFHHSAISIVFDTKWAAGLMMLLCNICGLVAKRISERREALILAFVWKKQSCKPEGPVRMTALPAPWGKEKVTYYSTGACRTYTAKKYFGDLPHGAVPQRPNLIIIILRPSRPFSVQ
jgi:hypothetical protein